MAVSVEGPSGRYVAEMPADCLDRYAGFDHREDLNFFEVQRFR
jgi:hypothetical protein